MQPLKNNFALFQRGLGALAGLSALALTSSCALSQPAPAKAPSSAATQPNVVFILADDLGWMDTSTYGSKFYDTPNIDRLRARGMMFTRAYSAHALCSPTRASILTGQHPARLRITAPRGHYPQAVTEVEMPKSAAAALKAVPAPTRTRLPLSYNTLGQPLKGAGYATGFLGKWHLGDDPYGPSAFGFDTVVGAGPFAGPRSYFSPYKMGAHLPDGPPGEQIDDRMGAEAVKFIEARFSSTCGAGAFTRRFRPKKITSPTSKRRLPPNIRSKARLMRRWSKAPTIWWGRSPTLWIV